MSDSIFQDITLIKNDDSAIIAEQKKMMNEDIVIMLDKVYKNGINCICGKNVKIFHKHIDSRKHKEFVTKHNIHIDVVEPIKKKKKPKQKGPIGRPLKYAEETSENRSERKNKYMINYFDNDIEKRTKHNKKVAEYRAKNLELCRERVRASRLKKKNLEK
jgi:hypothetical protein